MSVNASLYLVIFLGCVQFVYNGNSAEEVQEKATSQGHDISNG